MKAIKVFFKNIFTTKMRRDLEIIRWLYEPRTPREVQEKTDLYLGSVWGVVCNLVNNGYVKPCSLPCGQTECLKVGYQITDKGKKWYLDNAFEYGR